MSSTPFAHTINPQAGWHPVTADPRDVEAARRAGEASLAEFPYYRARFGERAAAFGASDGAWLLTLCQADEAFLHEQVLWLGRLLSARGVPRWLLERHLEILHAEALRMAEGEDRCGPLLAGAALLRRLRHQHLPERDLHDLSDAFAAAVGPVWSERLPRMGAILAAAAADEAAGIERAVTSIEPWATDPAAFPAPWIAAVRRTLAEARSRARR